MRTYFEMGLAWAVCASLLITSYCKPEQTQDMLFVACGLIFLMSIVICMGTWVIDRIKEDFKTFAEKEHNNAK